MFRNNSDLKTNIYHIELLKPCSALTFRGLHLHISDCYCISNSGQTGGFLFFDSGSQKMKSLIIFSSVFHSNIAVSGGAIGIPNRVKNMQIIIAGNYFTHNHGSGKQKKTSCNCIWIHISWRSFWFSTWIRLLGDFREEFKG